ncbi:fungal-specific transcription factor domain-containing protein [Bombardia bombarda]|uniref:Fungal-specific transcription factor domain-containing protein n=1 Tax=Bombardia bombarda TaxID=252184 RepID=A0AA39XAF5_9PEZI|nr:fungal-specific transcription factor domain-containing protein [Bombardia bombarda]
MSTAPSSPSSTFTVPSRPTFACIRCAERKVKCDRQRPCGACANHKVDCIFQPPPPPRNRHYRHIKDQKILLDKLRYYETLLQDQGIDPSKLADAATPDRLSQVATAVASVQEESLLLPSGSVSKTQLVQQGQGRSMFVDNSLWSRVVEEFVDSSDVLDDYSDDPSGPETSNDGDDNLDFVLGACSQPEPNTTYKSRHPPPKQIHQLWQIFIDNVDPLTKVIHAPTLQPAIQKAASNTTAVPRSFEALMFSIYGAAIMSLSEDECRKTFSESRKLLLSRYISATKTALSRAKFMGTNDLVVLQALIIHLLSVRDIYEPRAVWSLTGVAVRIAQAMGLERDGASLGLSPFESEMRRRIWWLLKTHDYRSAELCGLTKFRDLSLDVGPHSTKPPTNVNDDQIYPAMSSLPAESKTLTDMAFIALRYELVNFTASRIVKFRQQGKDLSGWDRDLASGGSDKGETDEAYRQLEELLETKYIRYCDPSQPLHLMTMLMARSSMNTIRFLTHHPRRWASMKETPTSERQWVWEVSIKLLEQYNMLRCNPQLKRFAWQAEFVMQWHAFIHVLDTLRLDPLMADAEKTWELISSTYENNPTMFFNTRKPIHVAVGSFCLKAYSARVVALSQEEGGPAHPTRPSPDFIIQLRQQREIGKSKRHAQSNAKRSNCQESKNPTHPEAHSMITIDADLDNTVLSCADASEPVTHNIQQSASPVSHPQLDLTQTGVEFSSLWLVNGLDEIESSQAVVNSSDRVMDTTTYMNSMSSHNDNTMEDGNEASQDQHSTILWEQWDTWLAESDNIMPSFSLDTAR